MKNKIILPVAVMVAAKAVVAVKNNLILTIEIMLKNIWEKISQNHLLMMIICCVIPLALIAGFTYLFKMREGSWVWLIVLLCPVMHIWMMKKHHK